jgi:ring-1,2-phenylacetyl-CoA epoxidase subunit PaaD
MVESSLYTKEELLNALEAICDPEIPVVSIREMGILRDVILLDNACEVIITPTYTGCPAMGFIEEDIIATLQNLGIKNVKVSTIYAPAWTTDWMSDATKEKLRKFGIAAPLHSSCVNWFQPNNLEVHCPKCNSKHTQLISQFGSTACKSLYKCVDCKEPFDYFKCH